MHERPTETPMPRLPRPLATALMAEVGQTPTTLAAAEAQQTQIQGLRTQVSLAVETLTEALRQNHANFLAGRPTWSYDVCNQMEQRCKTLKRQRQYLQDAFGACNRALHRMRHELTRSQPRTEDKPTPRAVRFVRAAELLLDQETLAKLWEVVDWQEEGE